MTDATKTREALQAERIQRAEWIQEQTTPLSRVAIIAFACLAWGLLFGGCSPKYYVPNTHNVPLLQQQGDHAASFAAAERRAEFQGAYALTPDLALMVNAAFVYPEDDEDGDGGKGHLVEAGLGYYRGLSPKIAFETYGLLAVGGVENHFPSTLVDYPSTTGQIQTQLLRYGNQSALGFKSKYVDVSASTRIAILHYFNTSGSLVFSDEDQVAYLRRDNTHLLIEPALTIRTGYGFLKLQIQIGNSYNLSHPDFRQDDGHLTVGVYIAR